MFSTGMLTALIIIEMGIRLFLPQSDRFYSTYPQDLFHKPNKVGYWYGENPYSREFAVKININSFGLRDNEIRREKLPETIRIAVVGDSFVESFQVDLENTFLKILEHQLHDKYSKNFEVINFGKAGLGPVGKKRMFLESLSFDPNIVLVSLNSTDYVDWQNEQNALMTKKSFLHNLAGDLTEISHLARLVVRTSIIKKPFHQADNSNPTSKSPNRNQVETKNKISQEVSEITRVSEEKNILVIFILDEISRNKVSCNSHINLLEDILKENDAPVISLTPIFCEHHDLEKFYFNRDGHWTVEGHKKVAEAVFQFLSLNNFVD